MLGESTTDHRNRTFVLVLLTFCPPGPDDRMYSKSNSVSGIDTRESTIK